MQQLELHKSELESLHILCVENWTNAARVYRNGSGVTMGWLLRLVTGGPLVVGA